MHTKKKLGSRRGRRPWDNLGRFAVAVFVNAFFEKRVEQLFELARRVEEAFSSAGLDYRVVGGLATYLYVEEAEPDAGRLTKDIDIAVCREDLPKIAKAVETFGLQYRHVAGVDMLVQAGAPSARRAVHIFATTQLGPVRRIRQIRLIPLVDLVRMKLTSFRLKDQVHLKDLDEARLITAELESQIPASFLERLAEVRSRE
jgi:hypothetical protein